MWIRMAFTDDDSSPGYEMPTLVAAFDEYTFDSWGRTPDFYTEEVAKYKSVREVEVVVDARQISGLFDVPSYMAQSVKAVE